MKMLAIGIIALVLLSGGLPSAPATPNVRTEAVQYRDGDQVLEGFLAYDASKEGKRPAVLVIHEWWGLNDYAKMRATQLAEMGYVAFALDMYGKGIVAKTADEASRLATPFFKDRGMMRRRAKLGLQQLMRQPLADTTRTAAIGFCFGGTSVMELAMSGANLKGAVTFHGVLNFPKPEDMSAVKGEVLILTGADDPSVPPDQLMACWNQLKSAGTKYQISIYSGAVHGFTNPANGTDNSKGVAYNERAATRAWQEMQDFFKEIFG